VRPITRRSFITTSAAGRDAEQSRDFIVSKTGWTTSPVLS